MNETPVISVIIPTHNRQSSLKRTLDALSLQHYPTQNMEVVVVADGCMDGTIAMLHGYQAPFTLKVIEQPGQGAAVARNQGATHANSNLLLFLDDDIEATPGLVEAHVNAHQQSNRVVIGYLPPVLQSQSSFFHIQLWAWWEEKFHTLRQGSHRYTYEDLLSGNFSLPRSLFEQVNGFDATFRCREDYELGARLLKADAQFVFAEDAVGYHRDSVTDLDRSLQRKRQEGRADVQFGDRHPELIPRLRLSCFGMPASVLDHLLLFLVFQLPVIGDILAIGLRYGLSVLEWLRMRGFWQFWNERLHGYWYLRGVVDKLQTHKALTGFLQGGLITVDEVESDLELNLQQGLAIAEQKLDEQRPKSLRLHYGQQPIGHIPPQVGAERLRGVHLRPALAKNLSVPLLQAIALEDAINPVTRIDASFSPGSTEQMKYSMQIHR